MDIYNGEHFINGHNRSVRVRNLSVAGALLESDDLPAVGTRVKLRKGDLSATGKIVRLDGGLAGVQFERLINPID